jgi:hypothetical protein
MTAMNRARVALIALAALLTCAAAPAAAQVNLV